MAKARGFPRMMANCGRESFSFWQGFRDDDMQSCVRNNIPLSTSCTTCFVGGQSFLSQLSCFWIEKGVNGVRVIASGNVGIGGAHKAVWDALHNIQRSLKNVQD